MLYPSTRLDHSRIHHEKVDTHYSEGMIMDHDKVVYRTGEVKILNSYIWQAEIF